MSYELPYDYRPDFVPSDDDCVLQTKSETRSRIWIGGTFFRSTRAGLLGNDISVACSLLEPTEENTNPHQQPPETHRELWRDIDGEMGFAQGFHVAVWVELIVSTDDIEKKFYAQQSMSIDISQQPPIITYDSAISSLRTQINDYAAQDPIPDDALIQMPPRGTGDVNDVGGIDADAISAFAATKMTGASGAPIDAESLSDIRTGPERSIVNMGSTEFIEDAPLYGNGSDDASGINIRQFDGKNWIPF